MHTHVYIHAYPQAYVHMYTHASYATGLRFEKPLVDGNLQMLKSPPQDNITHAFYTSLQTHGQSTLSTVTESEHGFPWRHPGLSASI